MPQVSRNNLIAYIPQTYQFLKGQAHDVTIILYQNQVGNQVEAYNAQSVEIKIFDKYLFPTPNFTFTKAANQITFGSTQAGTEGHIKVSLTQAQIDSIAEGAMYAEVKYVTSNNNIILPKLKIAEISAAGGVSSTGAVSGNVFTIPAPLYSVQSFLYASNDLPAAGKIVLNSSNPASVTKAVFNNTDERGKRNAYLENFLTKRFSEGSSDITIALTDISDTSIYHIYSVTNWTRVDLNGDSANIGIGDGIELTLTWESSAVSQNNTYPFTESQRIGILLDAIGIAGTSGNNEGSNLTVSSGTSGNVSYPNITEIKFIDGASIADGGNGTVEVTISGGASSTISDVTANIAAGAINIGDTVSAGTTLQDLVERLLLTTYNPTFVDPTFSLSEGVNPNSQEVGDTINVPLTFNFNRGAIKGDLVSGTWDVNATQDFRAGDSTSYTIDGNAQPGNAYTVSNHTVTLGSNTFSGTVAYGQGPQPLDSNGSNYDSPLSGGTSPSRSTSFNGYYPYFYGTSNSYISNPSDVATLIGNSSGTKVVADSNGTLTLNVGTSLTHVWLAVPSSYSLKNQWYETVTNFGDIASIGTTPTTGGDLFIPYATISVTSPDGYWSGINYTIYLQKPSSSGQGTSFATGEIQFKIV